MIAEIYKDLKSELQRLNREFSQPKEVWLGLIGQLEAVMVDEPQQPAIILLVVPDDSKGIATCLAHRLARAVQSAFEGVYVFVCVCVCVCVCVFTLVVLSLYVSRF